MAGIITQQDINNYKDQINKNGVGGAISVYQSLQSKGYTYAGWAGGVASGKTVTGQAALNFMAASSGKTFSESQLNNIRIDMANSYLNTLVKNIERDGGKTTSDISFEQMRDFHKNVFKDHGLNINNWTLEHPMSLVGKYAGKKAQEKYWQDLSKTEGDGVDALWNSHSLQNIVTDAGQGFIVIDVDSGKPIPSSDLNAWFEAGHDPEGVKVIPISDEDKKKQRNGWIMLIWMIPLSTGRENSSYLRMMRPKWFLRSLSILTVMV
ncbi:Uncharacterised protein [Neisseria canis]|uniref:Uncharacterized protein n=2 Tax=Neisseria canis TaxID=493 RepID=A0A3S4SFT6_9NEIS|nr:Uncharacterised protein [Neisseria canis]